MASLEKVMSKTRIISELIRSPHGDLDEYLNTGTYAAREDHEFFAHLIAWNQDKGTVRDAKVALPVISLSALRGKEPTDAVGKYRDNALAHLVLLSPRDLLRASRFAKGRVSSHHFSDLVKRYLREREANENWWDKTALAHRSSIHALYKFYRIHPSARAAQILNGERPQGSVFADLHSLRTLNSDIAARLIVEKELPFLSVMGALGKPVPEIGWALIERMTPSQLVNNTKMLERLGMATDPAMRAAYDEKLKQVSAGGAIPLKAQRAVKALREQGSDRLAEKLQGAQEKVLDLSLIKGSWLVLGDKSGSMSQAIEVSRQVAATLARVSEKVHLIFFDTSPRFLDVTGKDYESILQMTSLINAGGGTSIGCGLAYASDRDWDLDGIVVVSDGAENQLPFFHAEYTKYTEKFSKEPPVYFYRCGGTLHHYSDRDLEESMKSNSWDMQTFQIPGDIDYYSIMNLVATMRPNRYSLVDEIYETPLLTLKNVFRQKREMVNA